MKQTAVDWLHHKILNPTSHELLEDINLWFEKAKQIEKEQIIDAYLSGKWDVNFRSIDSNQFYQETYEKK